MKTRNRILSFALAAILALTLAPVSAHADPPKGDTHLHSWQVISDTPPTCTAAGSKTWRCTACGDTYTETYKALGHDRVSMAGRAATCTDTGLTEGIKCSRCGRVLQARETVPALGHDWDEGTVTVAPSGFTPGVTTFTCRRDPSHTRTEALEGLAFVFAWLHGFDFSTLTTFDIDPLVIVEQPQDGAISRWEYETLPLHVTASGGVGEYTYQWYSRSLTSSSGNWRWPISVGENAPTYEADAPGRKYYCLVTDAVGNTAASEYAVVDYKLGIAQQPDNANLQPTGKATLSCLAADGSGSYSYVWYNDAGDTEAAVGSEAELMEPGDYYCVVTDDETGETATSYIATVYSADPFRIVNITQDCEVLPDTDAFVIASFAGGVESYEVWWDKDGDAIDSVEGRDEANNVYSRATVDGAGVYTVHGVDGMYATASASVTITVPKLTIVEQPVGGTIPRDDAMFLYVQVGDGEGPYHYTLYRNGEEYAQGDSDTAVRYGSRVWYPGTYYFRIEDSRGRSIDSDIVSCEDDVLRIRSQTESASLAKPGDVASLFVEAEGGIEPYTYIWSYKRYITRYKVGDTRTFSADKPGEYMCRVVDADGNMINSRAIQVDYTGDTPIITAQPAGGILENSSYYLSCDAVSGSGGDLQFDWEVTPAGVRPSWKNVSRGGGSSRSIDATAAGAYRCKVTDTKTGKHVYTNAAFVAEPFSFGGVEPRLLAEKYTNISISAKGGMAPYTANVYVKYPCLTGTSLNIEYKNVLYAEWSANSLEELAQHIFSLDNLIGFVLVHDGELSRYFVDAASYYIEISDSLGNTVHSDYTPKGK